MDTLKKYWAKLTPNARKNILVVFLITCAIGLYQGFVDSVDISIKPYGCRYSSFWSYHPARLIPCEILRNRSAAPYVAPKQQRRRR